MDKSITPMVVIITTLQGILYSFCGDMYYLVYYSSNNNMSCMLHVAYCTSYVHYNTIQQYSSVIHSTYVLK